MDDTTPFHPGERIVQRRAGVAPELETWARNVVRPYLPDEHRAFYEGLPFLVAAARDARGRPWATLLTGSAAGPGFVTTPDPRTLRIAARVARGDALGGALLAGADLGLLGIELATRRRNRVSGRVLDAGAAGLTVAVAQSYGNCPQYIHPRAWTPAAARPEPQAQRSTSLTPAQTRWIEGADTFFLASGYRGRGEAASYGMDASHRGGNPGFVKVEDARTLLWPDYAGNNYFNTIGNLLMNPRLGMLLVDFEGGHLLQLTGTAAIEWQSAAVRATPGAQRLVRVTIDEVVERRAALPLRWRSLDRAYRSLQVVDKHRESADVASFVLASPDAGALPAFAPGQHLPLQLALPGQQQAVLRTYSLSAAADGRRYRISVKREPDGLASRHLHDRVAVGDRLNTGHPAGEFVLRDGTRPVVLLSAGVGVTPMMSMLEALAGEAEQRAVWFIHGARDGRHHPFAAAVRRLQASNPRLHVHASYSRPLPEDVPGRDHDHHGRVDGARLASLLPSPDVDVYLCGPLPFMSDLTGQLLRLGVPPAQIHAETFGPAS